MLRILSDNTIARRYPGYSKSFIILVVEYKNTITEISNWSIT
jgi:hypothetical protein